MNISIQEWMYETPASGMGLAVLAYVASEARPVTAFDVSRAFRLGRPEAGWELEGLARAGLLEATLDEDGAAGYVLRPGLGEGPSGGARVSGPSLSLVEGGAGDPGSEPTYGGLFIASGGSSREAPRRKGLRLVAPAGDSDALGSWCA